MVCVVNGYWLGDIPQTEVRAFARNSRERRVSDYTCTHARDGRRAEESLSRVVIINST